MKADVELVGSYPIEWHETVRDSSSCESMPYYGSLLDAVERIVRESKKSLVIMNPYWSRSGINEIVRRLDSVTLGSLDVRLITKHKLDVESREVLHDLRAFFESKGASTKIYYPQPIEPGREAPLMHAKAVIGDSNQAYVGSGNLTAHGLVHSIELGIVLKGKSVIDLLAWVEAIILNCVPRTSF